MTQWRKSASTLQPEGESRHDGGLPLEHAVSTPIVEIRHLNQHIGQTVTLRGWVRNVRTSKIRFIELRDGSGFVQCVCGAAEAESYELAGKLTQEAAITVTGGVQTHPKTGAPELLVKSLTLVGESVDYPITPKEHGTAFLMDNRH